MKAAGIIGVGLIGGSLAKCLKERCGFEWVVGFDKDEGALASALADGALDATAQGVGGLFSPCDVVFICTPVDTVYEYAKQLAPFLKPAAVLTDVGSTKAGVMAQMEGLAGINFIGGHPMAGSEATGYAASKAYLFENACYALCKGAHAKDEAMEAMTALVERLGGIPMALPASLHDHAVSCVSHAPHVVAAALVNAVRRFDTGDGRLRAMAAGGFKDVTRIASSSPELWNGIVTDNRREVLAMLACVKEEIGLFEDELSKEDGDATPLFRASKAYRDGFQSRSRQPYGKDFAIRADVEDKPGSIATVATLLSVNNINIKNIGVLSNREYEGGILQIVFDRRDSGERAAALLKAMNFTVFED